jgi:hypothetical protein
MPFDLNKFINPGQFADYSTYSGMGGDNQQMKSLRQVAAESAGIPAAGGAIPPPASTAGVPQSFDSLMKQAVAPVTNTITGLQNRFNQASQGNVFNAVTGQNPTAKQQPVGEQHDYEW